MVLSFGRKIEKYALSAQAIAKASKMLHDDLDSIWGKPKKEIESKEEPSGIEKIINEKKEKDDA